MRRLRTIGSIALLAASTLLACRALVGLEAPEVVERPEASFDAGPDADFDAGFDACATPAPTCAPVIPQRPPADAGDPADADATEAGDAEVDAGPLNLPRWFALRKLKLRTKRGDFPGVNLDCQESLCGADKKLLPGARGSCRPRGDSPVICDGPGGIDNGVLSAFEGLLLDNEIPLDIGTARGLNGVVLYVGNYNGLPSDPQVTVSVIGSPGILRRQVPCNGEALDGGTFRPCDNGSDEWALPNGSAVPNGATGVAEVPLKNTDSTAYVVGGELIAPGLGFLGFASGGKVMSLQSPLLRTRIRVSPEGQFVLEGVLAGVVDPVNALSVLRTLRIGTPSPLCQEQGLLEGFRIPLCKGLDSPLDRCSTDPACEGISVGFEFEATPAAPYVLAQDAGIPIEPDICADAAPLPRTLAELCP